MHFVMWFVYINIHKYIYIYIYIEKYRNNNTIFDGNNRFFDFFDSVLVRVDFPSLPSSGILDTASNAFCDVVRYIYIYIYIYIYDIETMNIVHGQQ